MTSPSTSSPSPIPSYQWCEPKVLHVGWMHNISATNISSWPRPIDCHAVAHGALEAANAHNNSISGNNSDGALSASHGGGGSPCSAGNASFATSTIQQGSAVTPATSVNKLLSAKRATATVASSGGGLFPSAVPMPTTPPRPLPVTSSTSWLSRQASASTSSFYSPAPSTYDQTGFDLGAAAAALTGSAQEAAAGLSVRQYQRGIAHFESTLKDNDLTDDRHLRRMMELLIPPGVFLHDHDVPRYVAASGPAGVIFQEGTSRTSVHFTGNPMSYGIYPSGTSLATSFAGGGGGNASSVAGSAATASSKPPLRWNWSVLKLAANEFLATFVTHTSFEEYQALGFALHLDCDSYETALRQARWMVAAGAIRLLVSAPDESGSGNIGTTSLASLKIHSEFVDQVQNETWRTLEKQRWLHFLSAIKRYTLPRKETYLLVSGTVLPLVRELPLTGMTRAHSDLRAFIGKEQPQTQTQLQDRHAVSKSETETAEQQEAADLQQQQSSQSDGAAPLLEKVNTAAPGLESNLNPSLGQEDGKTVTNLLRLRAEEVDTESTLSSPRHTGKSPTAGSCFNPYKIVYVQPSVFPPHLDATHLKALPPCRYIFAYKDTICDALLKAYMLQIATGAPGNATATLISLAWHNFFHAMLFSLLPTLEEAPLSIWHFPPLVDGLVPGTWFAAAPRTKKTAWDVALRVHRFLAPAEKPRMELGLFRPAAGGAASTNSSLEESNALTMFFQALVPLMRVAEDNNEHLQQQQQQQNVMSPEKEGKADNRAPGTTAAQAAAQTATTADGNQSTTSSYPSLQSKDIPEWTEPNVLLCEMIQHWRCYVMRCVQELEFRISRLFFCASRLQGQLLQQQLQRSAAAAGLQGRPGAPPSLEEAASAATFVRCTCDRCQEDTELVLKSDPFIARLIHPIAKQMARLLKRLAPTMATRTMI